MATTPTRRGRLVGLVLVAAVASGWLFGGRALDAVVAPGACALVVTGLLVSRARRPRFVRDPPGDGHAGERRDVSLRVEGGTAVVAVVRDALGEGLEGDPVVRTAGDGRRAGYAVTLRERGRHAVGPLRVTVGDPFGLWERTFAYEDEHEVTVYPRVVPLARLPWTFAAAFGPTDERAEFAGLREYRHGDPLRDVNWKASARRSNGYVLTTYAGDGANASIDVAVNVGPEGDADGAAVAAASLVVALLDAGLAVGLHTPEETLAPSSGSAHRRRVLEALAVLGEGSVGPVDRADARIVVDSTADGLSVVLDGDRPRAVGETAFDRLVEEGVP